MLPLKYVRPTRTSFQMFSRTLCLEESTTSSRLAALTRMVRNVIFPCERAGLDCTLFAHGVLSRVTRTNSGSPFIFYSELSKRGCRKSQGTCLIWKHMTRGNLSQACHGQTWSNSAECCSIPQSRKNPVHDSSDSVDMRTSWLPFLTRSRMTYCFDDQKA